MGEHEHGNDGECACEQDHRHADECACGNGHAHGHDHDHAHEHEHAEKSVPAIDYDVEQMGYGWEGVCPCGCGGTGHHVEPDGGDGAAGFGESAAAGGAQAWQTWEDVDFEAFGDFQQGDAFDAAGNLLDEAEEDIPEPAFAEFDFLQDGISFHVRRWGDAADIPLVLLHGFMQTGVTWAQVAPRLAQGHCLYAIDLLGHGQSDKPTDPQAYAIPAQADALAGLVGSAVLPQHAEAAAAAGRKPARRAHLLGYSMGGRIALDLVLRHADVVYSLMLESAGIGPADEAERAALAERAAGWARMLREQGMAAFADYWEQLPLFDTQKRLPQATREAVRAERLANDPEAMARCVECAGQHTMALADEAMEALGFSWTPVLFVAGTRDTKYLELAERFKREGMDAKPVMGGHDLHLEVPGLFCDALAPHLRANELRGA